MADTTLRYFLRRLRQISDPADGEAPCDARLLERFVTSQDQDAFALLVGRHGAMVLGVCRRVLRHEHDAEDAFQAAFLALARKAPSIRQQASLGGWLFSVAFRAALAARQRQQVPLTESRFPIEVPCRTEDRAEEQEVRQVLDEAVQALPEKFRVPFVLCHLQGLTTEEAARTIGCPHGTVMSRLSRARQRLQQGLVRRGVTLTSVSLASIAAEAVEARVPHALASATSVSAYELVSGNLTHISGSALMLMEGALRTMSPPVGKLILTAVAMLALAGVGSHAWHVLSAEPVGEPAPAEQKQSRTGGERPAEQGLAGQLDAAEKEEMRRVQSVRNLKTIGMALHNFSDTYGSFPPGMSLDARGKPLLSWRVMLLPYLEQNALYQEFRLNEPWDSPHNKALLPRMPKIYAAPGALPDSQTTYYLAFVGRGTCMEVIPLGATGGPGMGAGMGGMGMAGPGAGGAATVPGAGGGPPGMAMGPGLGGLAPGAGPGMPPGAGAMGPGGGGLGGPNLSLIRGSRMAEIVDGLSNTIMVAESAQAVPWTKPEELTFGPNLPLPRLGGLFAGDFHALFGDGVVRLLSGRAPEAMLRHAIQRDEGALVSLARLSADLTGRAGVPATARLEELSRDNAQIREKVTLLQQEAAEAREQMTHLQREIKKEKDSFEKRQNLLFERVELLDQVREQTQQLEDIRKQITQLRKELEALRQQKR